MAIAMFLVSNDHRSSLISPIKTRVKLNWFTLYIKWFWKWPLKSLLNRRIWLKFYEKSALTLHIENKFINITHCHHCHSLFWFLILVYQKEVVLDSESASLEKFSWSFFSGVTSKYIPKVETLIWRGFFDVKVKPDKALFWSL